MFGAAALHLAAAPMSAKAEGLMSWSELYGRPMPKADEKIAYGEHPQQYGELWLPQGRTSPAPLVILIHGGCWTKAVADLKIMNYAAAELRRRGYAVWNIEYRGVDETGGGYPGTYLDVAAGLDRAGELQKEKGLDVRAPILIGHSAGGHLALWAGARSKIAPSSPLFARTPLLIGGVIDLAGIANLKTDLHTACGAAPVRAMAGAATAARPDPYADTSPFALAPLGVPTVVLHGADDDTVPGRIGAAYAARARALGDHVQVISPPGGHVEEIAPGSAAFTALVRALAVLSPP